MNRSTQATLSSIAATALRICVGVLFVIHGCDKFLRGFDATADWLQSLGLSYVTLASPVLIGAEILGGIALILGLATRFVSLVLLVHTGFTWYLVHRGQGFFLTDGGGELMLLLAVILAGLCLSGSAGTGLDRLFSKRRRQR